MILAIAATLALHGQLPNDAFVGIWASEDNRMCWTFLKPERGKPCAGRSIWGEAYITFTRCKPVPNGSYVGDWHKFAAPPPQFGWIPDREEFAPSPTAEGWRASASGNIRMNPKIKDSDGYPTSALAAYAAGNDYSADWSATMTYVGAVDQIRFGNSYYSSALLARISFPARSTTISKGSFIYNNVQYDLECTKAEDEDPMMYKFKFIDRSTGDVAGGGQFQWHPSAEYVKKLRGGTSDGVDQLLVTFGFRGAAPKHGVFKAS